MGYKMYGAAAAFATLFTGAQAFAATILIDDFSTNQRVSAIPTAPLVDSNSTVAANAIGGTRDFSVNTFSGLDDATELRAVSGILAFSNIATSSGEAFITYDGDLDASTLDSDGLGGIDFTAAGTDPFFTFDVVSFDADIFIQVDVYDTFGGLSTFTEVLPEASLFSPILPFTDFTGDADFSSVGALQFTVRSETDDLDGAITQITIQGGDTPVVPLPASALLLLGGIGGLSVFRARRKA